MYQSDGVAVLLDVDGTLVDTRENQRQVWHAWACHFGLDPEHVHRVALRTRPQDTFALVAPEHDPQQCLRRLHELEDDDARSGAYRAFAGAAALLAALPPHGWALVTSNYEHRTRIRFKRTGLALPAVIVDAPAAAHGKPHPAPYLLAAERLGVEPRTCLVIEDSTSGVASGVAADMTVWAVNTDVPLAGAERHYSSLQAAATDIVRFAQSRKPNPHRDTI